MTIKTVLKMGNPVLRQVASPVSDFDQQLCATVEDMVDTMRAKGGVGLAAPQIGVSQRIVVIESIDNPRYPQAPDIPLTILINPEITPINDEMEAGYEGCLSVPGLRGKVRRYIKINLKAYDINGNIIKEQLSGFHARVLQHECDHLDGILYPERLSNIRTLAFEEELQAL